ncbi:MAG: hypothetical protein BGO23_04700 [Solirubrobacterales bacterium 67-14]|jgi:hypothetical protein|nr:MAG: hypothetical protein BGO23_04700 [Solirubrobacterales bacterium 67-14]
MAFVLIAFFVGLVLGRLKVARWSLVLLLLLPLPLYLAVDLGLWGDGLGENWEFGLILWFVPAIVGYMLGILSNRYQRKGSFRE